MSDSVGKGIGEQLGQLGKQIVQEVVQVPAKITGMDAVAPDETAGAGSSKGAKTQGQKQNQQNPQDATSTKLAEIARRDEAEKQQQLAQARRLLQQFIEPTQQPEQSVRDRLELEEMEKKKKEIEEERKKAAAILKPVASKTKRGNLYGVKQKQFGGELGKNSKAQ